MCTTSYNVVVYFVAMRAKPWDKKTFLEVYDFLFDNKQYMA